MPLVEPDQGPAAGGLNGKTNNGVTCSAPVHRSRESLPSGAALVVGPSTFLPSGQCHCQDRECLRQVLRWQDAPRHAKRHRDDRVKAQRAASFTRAVN